MDYIEGFGNVPSAGVEECGRQCSSYSDPMEATSYASDSWQ